MAPRWDGRQSTVLQCWAHRRECRCGALQRLTAHLISEDSTTSIATTDFTTSTVPLLSTTSVFHSLRRFHSITRIPTTRTGMVTVKAMVVIKAVTESAARSWCNDTAGSRAVDIPRVSSGAGRGEPFAPTNRATVCPLMADPSAITDDDGPGVIAQKIIDRCC